MPDIEAIVPQSSRSPDTAPAAGTLAVTPSQLPLLSINLSRTGPLLFQSGKTPWHLNPWDKLAQEIRQAYMKQDDAFLERTRKNIFATMGYSQLLQLIDFLGRQEFAPNPYVKRITPLQMLFAKDPTTNGV